MYDGKRLFLLGGGGLLQMCDPATGKEKWAQDLAEDFYSSLALAGNTLIAISRKGQIFAIEAGDAYKLIAKHLLGEACNTSPVFHGNRMYIRGKDNLFCFGE